jgi:hypothetical protein
MITILFSSEIISPSLNLALSGPLKSSVDASPLEKSIDIPDVDGLIMAWELFEKFR